VFFLHYRPNLLILIPAVDNNFLGEGTAGNQIDAMRNAAENARANLMRGEEEKEKIIARKKAELTRYVEIALKGKTEEDIRMEKMEALLAYAARRDGKKTA